MGSAAARMFEPPLSDRELWNCAVLIEKQCGEDAPAFIAARMSTLASEGDDAGVAQWRAIADRYDRLQSFNRARRWLPT